ncbi:hypothetical protein [Halomarina oriensis]|uniref:DUF8056 domain-containing protein n=1 Tax=Halomarina oriensis TaxID=671145 RepID=A0A6B0GIL3_9EURY|nr:hypothetical protein [Halomarina oriensis]MWG33707.1 hypothetical protein [Halomarina oriensis]
MSETAQERSDEDERSYSGLFGAFPYAFRTSDSRLFRAYVVVGGLFALLVTLVFALALVTLLGQTAGAGAGTFTFSRSLFILVGLFAVAPLVAPVLFVARQHRRDAGETRYDLTMAGLGFLFLLSLYVATVISIPPEFVLDGETVQRGTPSGLFAPVIAVLYTLPSVTSVVPPTLVGLSIYVAHRRLG